MSIPENQAQLLTDSFKIHFEIKDGFLISVPMGDFTPEALDKYQKVRKEFLSKEKLLGSRFVEIKMRCDWLSH